MKSPEALEYFKDWTNTMLVTTTAAMGWVANLDGRNRYKTASIVCLALSIAFAIFTLALVPLVAEQLKEGQSIYDVRAEFNLLWMWWVVAWPLKIVCWPQHVLFLLGIGSYTYWQVTK